MPHGAALFNAPAEVLRWLMRNTANQGHPRALLLLAAIAAALLTGAAFAGWLNHGPQIFLSMAADAWAYCF